MPTSIMYTTSPREFQNAMIFIDGTNLFYRLEAAKLKVPNLKMIFDPSTVVEKRQIKRICLYTVEQHFIKAKAVHGESFCDGIKVIYGDGIPIKDKNIKEKGVDVLLTADLVYHATMKNYDYVLLVSSDTDFVFALSRVEDFGCRTAVLGICSHVPERLRLACDHYIFLDNEHLINRNLAVLA